MDAGRLDTLVLKLRHPLTKIRFRALQSLLFKLREELIGWQELEPLQTSFIPSLLTCLEPQLELETLHILELLLQSQSETLIASLQHFGAAPKLQRAAHKNPELQAKYEKVLRQIYVTKVVTVTPPPEELHIRDVKDANERHITPSEDKLVISTVLFDGRKTPKVNELEAKGWRFAPVTLSSVDDQFLFEFEVKLHLRTKVADIATTCVTFRNVLLRNFPAEVFLQRPAVLQYLLHLVQQPILLPPSQEKLSRLLDKAMHISMGVNYFNDMGDPTFSTKRGNCVSTVVMASVKALESFLEALKRTQKLCLDPTYVVPAPNQPSDALEGFESRRMFYPRAPVNALDQIGVQNHGLDQMLNQFSYSGAIYRLFLSLLPLLRSPNHPRLHLLNLLLIAVPELAEKSPDNSLHSDAWKLNKWRLEHLLRLLSGICRPVASDQADDGTVFAHELELTHSMTWKLVELVLQLLQLYPSSHYCIETENIEANHRTVEDKTDRLRIPYQLWNAVTLWLAHPGFSDLATNEWNAPDAIIEWLAQIDGTLPALIRRKHSAQSDVNLILDFVKYAQQHQDNGSTLTVWTTPPHPMTLNTAKKVIQARRALTLSIDAQVVSGAVLRTLLSVLSDSSRTVTDTELGTIREILFTLLTDVKNSSFDISGPFFNGFLILLDACRVEVLTPLLCDIPLLTMVLLLLARKNSDEPDTAALWGIVRHALTLAELSQLKPLVPLLQHFAYMEPSPTRCQEYRSLQPNLVQIVNDVEPLVPSSTQLLSMCRCLLHVSSYLRTAAASGLLRRLSSFSTSTCDVLSNCQDIRDDPFQATNNQNKSSFLNALVATSLPTRSNGNKNGNLSSELRTFATLCSVLVSRQTSASKRILDTAWSELVLFLDHASMAFWTVVEERNQVSELFALLGALLHDQAATGMDDARLEQVLLVFRMLLFRSCSTRATIRQNASLLESLVPLIFHDAISIRAQLYYILMLLTCSQELFVPTDSTLEAQIPLFLESTFGLYADRWCRCGFVLSTFQEQVNTFQEQFQTDTMWEREVLACMTQESTTTEVNKNGLILTHLNAEYTVMVDNLRLATSHGKCLNAVYHLLTLCTAWQYARARFLTDWAVLYDRYVCVKPQSGRDEVILSALVALLSRVVGSWPRKEQLNALLLVKRTLLPLFQRSYSPHFALQVAHLLLTMRHSSLHDVFLSLAADTDMLTSICQKYATQYTTDGVLHALILDVVLQIALAWTHSRLSTASSASIAKRLIDLLAPLLTIVCRHRSPHSFLDRDAFQKATQCLMTIWTTCAKDALVSNDAALLEHTDRSLLFDGTWASRLILDHVAPMRALGFMAIERATLSQKTLPALDFLTMAYTTFFDTSEADAVRFAAGSLLTTALRHYHGLSKDEQAALVKICHGIDFSKHLVELFVALVQKSELLALQTLTACALLVRLLSHERDRFAPCLGNLKHQLAATVEKQVDVYQLLTETLSLRFWRQKCTRWYRTANVRLSTDDDDVLWQCSLLPAICQLLSELLQLFQVICHDAEAPLLLQDTTLLGQLVELMTEIAALNDDKGEDEMMTPSQYELLELCVSTVSLVVVRVFDGVHNVNLDERNLNCDVDKFLPVMSKCLDPRHPVAFRISFARILPCMSCLLPQSLESSDPVVLNALGSRLYDLYVHVVEFRPLAVDPVVSKRPKHVFPLAWIHRVACALKLLVESHPSFQVLLRVNHAVEFTMTSIKTLFQASRLDDGGFMINQRVKRSTRETYQLELMGRLQTHFEVLSALVGGDKESQQRAQKEGLVTVLWSNWSFLQTAHARGSHVMRRALELLVNYTYENDTSRRSIGCQQVKVTKGVQTGTTFLSLLVEYATSPDFQTLGVSTAACQVLQSVLLYPDCVLATFKAGLLAILMAFVDNRLDHVNKTSKMPLLETTNLAQVLQVLCNIAATEEGAQILYSSWASQLGRIFHDVMNSSSAAIQQRGCLFLRNLALASASKHHFAVWEELLEDMIEGCGDGKAFLESSQGRLYLSTALWSLVYDNQKARTLVGAKRQRIELLLSSYEADSRTRPQEILDNFGRILKLVNDDDT